MNTKTIDDLLFVTLGNGVVVCDRTQEEYGDYKRVAHIYTDRSVKVFDPTLPAEQLAEIEEFAATANPSVSTSQPERKVFS